MEIENRSIFQLDGLMSGVGPDRRSGYKLVPQSNSEDSDLSEEELNSLYEDGFQIIRTKRIHSAESVTLYRTQNIEMMNSENTKTKGKHIFPLLEKDSTSHCIWLMSTKRKLSFGISIFICFFCIVLFLLLPCEWANCSCKSSFNTAKEIWQKMIRNIELRGPLILINSTNHNHFNFLLMARGSIFADTPVIRTNYTSSSGGDILVFDGFTGSVIWRKHFNKMPSEIDCALFSIKNQLPKDCVIVSYGNYITVVSSDTGKTFWNLPLNTRSSKTKEMFPIIVPDMNNDNVSDFIVIKDINKLLLISGINGAILDNDFKLISRKCTDIKDLKISDDFTLKLDCNTGNNNTNVSVSLRDHPTGNVTFSEKVISQHYSSSLPHRIYIHEYYIDVINEGTICPRKCNSRILIRNKKQTVWSYQSDYSYTMIPISFDFKHSRGIYGFIFKIWEHEHEDTEIKKTKMWHHDVKLTVSFLHERTIMVVFNSAFSEPVQIINASYPVLQLYDANKSIQPDPVTQKYSLTIADISKNGSRQIISYYSTFEDEKRDNYTYSDYTLKSYIRMYDLEKEISKSLNITSS